MINSIFNVMPPDPGWVTPWPRENGASWWYPVCIMIGFAVAILAGCLKLWKRYKVSVEPFYWFILIGVPTAILGARFGSCAIGQTPWSDFWKFLQGEGGLAIEWGVMLTVIVAFIYFPLVLRRPSYKVRDYFSNEPAVKRVSMWMYFDAIVPAILIAQFIGRWGNYCNQEVFGKLVTDENLAWFLYRVFPGMYIKENVSVVGWYQPLFLWEGIGNLGMFFILYFGVEFIPQRKAGDLAAGYFIWYGIFRACLEPLRYTDEVQGFYFLTSIIVSILWAVLGGMFILINHLLISKVRDKKVWHALVSRGPNEVFRIIGAGWKPEKNERYKNPQLSDCVRTEVEKIYFGAW